MPARPVSTINPPRTLATKRDPPTIVVLGGINMDLIGVADRLPRPGETLTGERFYTAPGGKGANQAVAAARMGAKVRMVGRVGRDSFGPTLLSGLRGHDIDVSGVAEDPDNPSGIAMILLDAKRQNHIVQVRGANMACDEAQLKAARSAMEGADLLLLQQELPFDVSIAAARIAKELGAVVVWDPAPPSHGIERVLSAVDVITPNQTEAAFLTGIEVTDAASARPAADALLDAGAPVAVIKLGQMGVWYASADEQALVPAHPVETVDTIAAGDAFAGAMAVALAEGGNLAEAVRYGAAAGALAVTRPGAQEAMPGRDEVEALLARSGR